jgi:ADP-heptose:LPS heptosyltransferase
MSTTFKKVILWDFLQLLGKKEGIRSLKKVRYLFEEIISRIAKWTITILFIPKWRDSESKLMELGEDQGLEEIPCNLCGPGKIEIIGRKRSFRVVECSNCGLRFVTPRFNRKGRKSFYYSKYRFLGYSLFNTLNKLNWVTNEHLVGDQVFDIITVYKRSGDLIEIGPFGQELTKIAPKKGFTCWRLVSNGWVCDSPLEEREYGTENECVSVNHKKFDVVSCLDILDRMPDPSGELKGLHKILKDGGVLLIRLANYGSAIAEERGKDWNYNRPWEIIYQFDYVRLRNLLDKSGFMIVDLKTELSDGIGFVGGIILVGMKKNWGIHGNNPRILVAREGAAGDVLLTTPIVKELKRKFPNSYLIFKTQYPEILKNNPYVDEVARVEPKDGIDVVFNLMYELYPDIPIVEAYGKIAQLRIEYPEIEFYLSPEEKKEIKEYMKTLSIEDLKGFVVIHPLSGNRIKKWNGNSYQVVSDYICSRNLRVLTVGSPLDCVELKGAINLIGKLSLRQSAALISKAQLFMGLDSYPMHIADAFKIPSVILFGSTDPRKVLMNGHTVKPVQSSEHCLGCRHDTTPDRWKQNVDCRRGRLYCMENISADRVIEEIDGILKSSCEK